MDSFSAQLTAPGGRAGEEPGGHADPALPREWKGLFEGSPFGLILVDRDGLVHSTNRRATELLRAGEWRADSTRVRCCELICGALGPGSGHPEGACFTHLALAADSALPETRLELDMGGVLNPVWVTAAQVEGEGAGVVLYLRPEKPAYGDRRAGPRRADAKAPSRHRLRIHTLGRSRVEVEGRDVGGDWLRQRPGQLLAYLVGERNHVAASEQISEALWPKVLPWSTNSVRHQVHSLRERLDPNRSPEAPSSFVITRRGGYMLDPEQTWIDADEFEDAARSGLSLFVQGQGELARGPLEHAVELYQGDLLSEHPYAEWAVEERGRLRELAESAIRALISVRASTDNLAGAADCARRLADMEPFDMDVQREYLAICIRRGRRSEAMRRYALIRRRLRRELGHDPDFTLADLAA